MTGLELEFIERTLKGLGHFTHHISLSRGYCKKNLGWIERYNGKFGKGYLIHYPTTYLRPKSNALHYVAYVIDFQNK